MAITRALCPVLVGREKELTQLEDALLTAMRGDGQVVLLAGDAGLGKTRLAMELATRARAAGTLVLWGGCSEAELALPYLPFLEAIGNYLEGADLELVGRRLGPARRHLAAIFPQLESAGAESVPELDPDQGKLRLYEAVLTLLAAPARDQGLLLVLEDLHWADASTRELLDYLTRRLRSARILVLGSYRQDELHRRHPLLPLVQGWRRTGTQVVELAPLSVQGVADMVSAIFDDPTRDDTRDYLHSRTEGNPFVVEELLKAALDQGDIFRTAGGRWERKAIAEMRLPASVRDTILLRLERVSPEQLEIVRAAAVLGAAFADATLLEMAGGEETAMHETLQACVQQQLLEEVPQARGRYRFRHALTREAIYDDLIAAQRQRLHARAAEVLSAQPGVPAVEICQHLLEAGQWERAVPACLAAAAEAVKGFAFQDAALLYERALPHVADPVEQARLLCSLGNALLWAGQAAAARRNLIEGIAALESAGLAPEAAHHSLSLGACWNDMNEPEAAVSEYERARDVLEGLGPSEDLAMVHARLALQHGLELKGEAAETEARRAIEIAEAVGADLPRVCAYGYLGFCLLAQEGRDGEALEWLDRSWQEALSQGFATVAQFSLFHSIVVRGGRDRFSEMPPLLEKLRAVDAGPRAEVASRQLEAGFAIYTGDLDGALRILNPLLAQAKERQSSRVEALARMNLCQTLTRMGRIEEARPFLPTYDDFPDRWQLWQVLCVNLEFALAAGEWEAALEHALRVPEVTGYPAFTRRMLCDRAVAVLLAAGRGQDAESIAALTRDLEGGGGELQQRADARLAIARGELAEARRLLHASCAGLPAKLLRPEEVVSHALLASVVIDLGERDEAVAQLEAVVRLAGDCGMAAHELKARESLRALGVETTSAAAASEPVATGEKLVTVVFADVRGYTAMMQEAVPSEMAEKIAALQRWARQEVERQHGHVDKFAGDAVMAVFNVSGQHVDHALHAFRAALAIRDRAGYLGLPLGIGIATGAAIVGTLAEGANVSVLGETTNLAARLQSEAGAGEILCSSEAYRRVREALKEPALEERLQLKGFVDLVTVHRIRP